MEFANKHNMLFFESSAKTGYNIDEVFMQSAKTIAQKIDNKFYDLTSETCGIKQGIGSGDTAGRASHVLTHEDQTKKNKKKGCC